MEHRNSVLRYVQEDSTPISGASLTDFGLRVISLMARRRMGIDELAHATGFERFYLEALLRDEEPAPSIEIVRGLSYALRYPVSYFSPATDIEAATARDEEVYRDWLRMQRMERGQE